MSPRSTRRPALPPHGPEPIQSRQAPSHASPKAPNGATAPPNCRRRAKNGPNITDLLICHGRIRFARSCRSRPVLIYQDTSRYIVMIAQTMRLSIFVEFEPHDAGGVG